MRKNAIIIGLLGALAFLAIFPLTQAYTAPSAKWSWICKTGVAYSWTVNVSSTVSTETWTFTGMANTSVNQGHANGTITGTGFTSNVNLPLYSLDFAAETYDLTNANNLRTGGWLPYSSLSVTFPGGVVSNITWPPTYSNQMKLLNKSLWAYIEGASVWGVGNIGSASNITYLLGEAAAWRVSYVHASSPKRMMNWTIAVTGLVKSFVETDAAGAVVASADYQYPPVGFFGFDPSVDASLWIGIIILGVGIVYTLGTKKQDKRDDAEEDALKKMVAEKAGSAPAPKKEGE